MTTTSGPSRIHLYLCPLYLLPIIKTSECHTPLSYVCQPLLSLPRLLSFYTVSFNHFLANNFNFHTPISFYTRLAKFQSWMNQTISPFLTALLRAAEENHTTIKVSTTLTNSPSASSMLPSNLFPYLLCHLLPFTMVVSDFYLTL